LNLGGHLLLHLGQSGHGGGAEHFVGHGFGLGHDLQMSHLGHVVVLDDEFPIVLIWRLFIDRNEKISI
jgi:hypothetical protein